MVGKKLIPYYRIRWMQDIGKTLAHSVVFTKLTFRSLSPSKYQKVQNVVSKIPFLWSENLLEDGSYIATLGIPSTEVISTNVYVNDGLGDLAQDLEVGFLKPNESANFTIPYNMYRKGAWQFDQGDMRKGLAQYGPAIEK